MRKWIVSLLVVGVMASGAAYAASDNHTAPGTPGDPNCAGQSVAYLAQIGPSLTPPIKPGLGNLAKALNMSVQDLHDMVDAYCSM